MKKRLLAVALLIPLVAGCAMKRDVRDLQAEIGDLRTSQERLLREIQRQNAAILDTLTMRDTRLRGDFLNQLVQIERQLVQVQELTGQGQQRLAELRETLQQREEALRRVAVDTEPPPGAGDPTELFDMAQAAFERGSMSTARAGFEEFIRSFPQDARTPSARLGLASIFVDAGAEQDALSEYGRILELHPNAPEAASALFRVALIEADRGNGDRARSMLNQLTAAYPSSPEASEAREQLRRMR
ncbi:MAG TPA: tetratricopeptide repeat protein [Longimicrobiaceae bacterium]|nr:tetratricopeptide repeat protein [Longimicrobiaceae bacterium]